MAIQTAGYFILGTTTHGHKFRPSDWVERIASAFASFGDNQRICYNPMVMPARYHDQPSLFVAAHLAIRDPAGYNFIMEFARSCQLLVKTSGQPDMAQAPAELLHVA